MHMFESAISHFGPNRTFAIPVLTAFVLLLLPKPPVTAQCTSNELTKLFASDPAAMKHFGYSLSVSGETAIIGTPQDNTFGANSGAAYIFIRTAGVWSQQAKLLASDGAAGDFFGYSVSISGDTAIVSAHLDDEVFPSSGSAYVFVRSGTVWTQQARLNPSDPANGDLFATYVAVHGNTALVGSSSDDNANGGNAGSAYVFIRTGTVWSQQAKLLASDGAASDAFGIAVAIENDTALIGAVGNDPGALTEAGAAYVFLRSGTVWSQQAKLTAADAVAGDDFGRFVALSNDTALVGAAMDDNVGSNSGSAYVYTRSGVVWSQEAKLTAPDAVGFDYFGWSGALEGNTVLIGAFQDSHGAIPDAGSGYVFTRASGVWTHRRKYIASDFGMSDLMGRSVAIFGDIALMGANQESNAGGTGAGSVYVFDLNFYALGDLDADDDVDMIDTAILADVLVGADTDALHVSRADLNCSGTADGLDIQPYVAVFIP